MEIDKEVPPLTQPLENIKEIKQALSHDWQPFDSAPDGVDLLWGHPGLTMVVADKKFIARTCVFRGKIDMYWQPLPFMPKEIINVQNP